MILRAPKAKKFYKNENAWLNAVYRKNKELIDFSYPAIGGKSSKQMFKNTVKAYKSKGKTTYQAVQLTTHTSAFTSGNPETSVKLFQENIYKGIFSSTTSRNKFLKLLKKEGFNEKDITPQNFRYHKKDKVYTYGNIMIETTYNNHLIITKITNEELEGLK